MAEPACVGSAALFDSEDLMDHLEARHICYDECQLMEWCKRRLLEARKQAMPGFGPSGTWAGELIYSKDRTDSRGMRQYRRAG